MHPYCGSDSDTVVLSTNINVTTTQPRCDSLIATVTGLSNFSYHLYNSTYDTTNTTGFFHHVPSGNYTLIATHLYCGADTITVNMGGINPPIISTLQCDSIYAYVPSYPTVTYAVYDTLGMFIKADSDGYIGSLSQGTYWLVAIHPYCGSDSTLFNVGGIPNIVLDSVTCDSIHVYLPGYPTGITYSIIGTNYTATNTSGAFGNIPAGAYTIVATHPYCGSDTLLASTIGNLPNLVLDSIYTCDSVCVHLPNYPTGITYILSNTAYSDTSLSGCFGNIPVGTYTITATHPYCGSSSLSVTVGSLPALVVTQPLCDSLTVNLPNYTTNVNFLLHHIANTYADTNNVTGFFHHIYQGQYQITATYKQCTPSTVTVTMGGIPTPTIAQPLCDSIVATVSGVSNIQYFLQDLGSPPTVLDSNFTGTFGQIAAGTYLLLAKHQYCGQSSAIVTTQPLPVAQVIKMACDSLIAFVPAYPTGITYQLTGTNTGTNITNTTGYFGQLHPDTYTITATHPLCGNSILSYVLTPIPPMTVSQTTCDSICVEVLGFSNITYFMQGINGTLSQPTGCFAPVDSGSYLFIASHPNCGSDSFQTNMGTIPFPSILQKTCDSIIVSVPNWNGVPLLYEVRDSNGVVVASNYSGYFGQLATNHYTVVAIHPHCGTSYATISLSNTPIAPIYCVRPYSSDSAGSCKFRWHVTLNNGQHPFVLFQNGNLVTPTPSNSLIYELSPNSYAWYDSLRCASFPFILPNVSYQLIASPINCPADGCFEIHGGMSDSTWQVFYAANDLASCGTIGNDFYYLQNPPVGVAPVSTDGSYCGLLPGNAYTVYHYTQFAYNNGGCALDTVNITLPTSSQPQFSPNSLSSVLCGGDSVSSVTMSVTGSSFPVTYELLNPPVGYSHPTMVSSMSSSFTFEDLPEGCYQVRVSDCNAGDVGGICVLPQINIAPESSYYCDSSLHLYITLAGFPLDSIAAVYTWSNISNTWVSNQAAPILTQITPDSFLVNITMPNGCALITDTMAVNGFNASPVYTPTLPTGLCPTPLFTNWQAGASSLQNLPIYPCTPLSPTNYWTMSLVQDTPIVATMVNTYSHGDTAFVTFDSANVYYYYHPIFTSEYGSCPVNVSQVFAPLNPLSMVELKLSHKIIYYTNRIEVELQWKTKDNTNQNGYFIVQRHYSDENEWQKLTDTPIEYKSGQNNYTFIDNELVIESCPQEVIYRVIWNDVEGKLLVESNTLAEIVPKFGVLYPNPVTKFLNVPLSCQADWAHCQLKLYDEIGREIEMPSYTFQSKNIQFSVEKLISGSYILKILYENGKFDTVKFVKE